MVRVPPVVAEIHPPKRFWKRAHIVLVRQVHLCGMPVPVGFHSDGATVVWILRLFFPPISGDYLGAAVLHDWLLETGHSRKYAATMFRRAMAELGVHPAKRWLLYNGVCAWDRWRGLRKKFTLPALALALVFFVLGGGCSAAPPGFDPEPWVLGGETEPPRGCRDLRERDPGANC